MNILSIESSSRILSVALNSGGRNICQFKSREKFKSEHIINLINKVLDRGKITLAQVDYIAVGLGPGSFTGLRVGLASAKALALALKIKIVGISSLDCIAANVKDPKGKDICVIVDARRSNLYCAILRKPDSTAGLKLEKKLNYCLLSLERLCGIINSPTIFIGDGLENYAQGIKKNLPGLVYFADKKLWFPEAKTLAMLAYGSIKGGKYSSKKILPIYLYPKECQIRDEKI